MKIAFVKPDYPHETRIAILPNDIPGLILAGIEPIIETGFGQTINIGDEQYLRSGATIASRLNCYLERVVFNLKLTQPSDYGYLRPDHVLVGWTHPYGSGSDFYNLISSPLGITLLDIDSVAPRIFHGSSQPVSVDFFPPHMFWKNSYNAGIASVRLAMQHVSLVPHTDMPVCVLGSGSVAQGAFHELSRLGFVPRMFYRKTLDIFRDQISDYELIVNGIEVDTPGEFIIDEAHLEKTRPDVFIIEAAADAGNAVYGTEYQTLDRPVATTVGRRYLLVNNAPTIMTGDASRDISRVVTKHIVPAITRNRIQLGL